SPGSVPCRYREEARGIVPPLQRPAAGWRSEVQKAQRVALSDTLDRQRGHSRVVAAAGASFAFRRFPCLTSTKITQATIRKSRTSLRKIPWSIAGAPAVFAAARLAYGSPDRLRNSPEKSTFPTIRPIGGIRTSFTSDETIFPNAAPMMIPIAMSRTFPCSANFLNSFSTVASRRPTSAPDPVPVGSKPRRRPPEIAAPDEQVVGVVRADDHQAHARARQGPRERRHEAGDGEVERPFELQGSPAPRDTRSSRRPCRA